MSNKAKVAKNFSTGGIPGVTGDGSNFQPAKVGVVANGAKGNGGAAGSGKFDAGKGAIGNSGGIPDGAK